MSKNITPSNVAFGQIDQALLAADIAKALRATVFSSGLSIAPRLVQGIAEGMAARFVIFGAQGDEQTALTYGTELARDGLGVPSVLAMTEQVRLAAYQTAGGDASALHRAGSFCNHVVEGFVQAHAAKLLAEQERVHRAYLAALDSGSVFPRRAEPLA